MAFAERTTVSVPKTRGEIEALVERYGASRFASGWQDDTETGALCAAISFAARGRLVRFKLKMPTREETIAELRKKPSYRHYLPADSTVDQALAAEQRRRWRCLLLVLKAKLESIESGIETFDEAFLANIVTDGNLTVYEAIRFGGAGVKLLGPMESSG